MRKHDERNGIEGRRRKVLSMTEDYKSSRTGMRVRNPEEGRGGGGGIILLRTGVILTAS